ncbi:MAG TPA: anthranilate synthase component I [Candidatus Angelobacter sp.]|nr:anthranilate synthase component I [Candidatus Angelobacter sp.]
MVQSISQDQLIAKNETPSGVDFQYTTRGGITVIRRECPADYPNAILSIISELDRRQGVILASSYEYPGRYTRWDIGFIAPPLSISLVGRSFSIIAHNQRGQLLMRLIRRALESATFIDSLNVTSHKLEGRIREPQGPFFEEDRTKQPTVFSLLRKIIDLFQSNEDGFGGLYGAFGYDLAFQFEPIQLHHQRASDQRDMVLFLPDQLLIVDHQRQRASTYSYDFVFAEEQLDTRPLERSGETDPYQPAPRLEKSGDHAPGEYAECVENAIKAFQRGDLFEVVPSQMFFEPCPVPPSEVFARLRERNPAPYTFFMNLGNGEYLVGASPEMFLRVTGRRVETCPISGTIARGSNAWEDSEQILKLLNSEKDASELTMCTDVDRNDKSRICVPGSIKVIGRRQIEMYSRLIHTVDHVEGTLRDGFDSLDAFVSHIWAVTLTGAPKRSAMQFIEKNEKSPRRWYGGAVGKLGFNNDINTGLTLRTLRIKDGTAEIRVGATLLYGSDPIAEEQETRLKGSALMDALKRPRGTDESKGQQPIHSGARRRVLLVDHQDSFVHTLADYFRQNGADVVTLRAGFARAELEAANPSLVVLSPGPGRPKDFDMSKTIRWVQELGIPLFGVCLGLQGIVEYLGGSLGQLSLPHHGKYSSIHIVDSGKLFEGLPPSFRAGRYHSLYANRDSLPECLKVTAETEDNVVMAIEHRELPWAAVQFHPESIMTSQSEVGLCIVANVVRSLVYGERELPLTFSNSSRLGPMKPNR